MADRLGEDPKARMDADLVRMKTFIETGKPPHDAAQPTSPLLRQDIATRGERAAPLLRFVRACTRWGHGDEKTLGPGHAIGVCQGEATPKRQCAVR